MSASTPWEAGRFDKRGGPRKVLFGQMYEDVGVERAAFPPGARVFAIASAGDTAMALSLTHEVTAIDINPVQLDYARARLNGAPAITGTAEGMMGLGRGAMALFGWRRAVLERFLALDDPAVQREYWRAHLDTLGFRLATDVLLSLSGLKAVYASPFLAILPSHFGRVMRQRLTRCFATYPNRANPYARALLLGELPSVPVFDASRITLVGGDAAGFLDPFTGEGLHRALVSARLAADAVDVHLRGGSGGLTAYDRAMRGRFATKDRVSLLVQAFLARPPLFEHAARRLARKPDIRATMGLVMGDLVPASRALDPRFLAALIVP